jgi:septum formation protein
MRIVLASSSARRIELMKSLVEKFTIIKPTFDESMISKDVSHYPLLEAKNKYLSIKSQLNPHDLVISCDTVVVIDGSIIGKPKDLLDAFRILKSLSGRTHEVISSYVIVCGTRIIEKEVTTKVTFNELSDDEIKKYISEEVVMDKAGAYAIQDDEKYGLVKSIEGSYYNVMGFPLESIRSDLVSLGVIE